MIINEYKEFVLFNFICIYIYIAETFVCLKAANSFS